MAGWCEIEEGGRGEVIEVGEVVERRATVYRCGKESLR